MAWGEFLTTGRGSPGCYTRQWKECGGQGIRKCAGSLSLRADTPNHRDERESVGRARCSLVQGMIRQHLRPHIQPAPGQDKKKKEENV